MYSKLVIALFLYSSLTAAAGALGDDEGETRSWFERIEVSGEVRARGEGHFNYDPSFPADAEYGFALLRTRLKIEAQPAPTLRVVLQFQDSRTWGEEPSTAAAIDNIDLHQGYFVWDRIGGGNFAVTVGRQELSYGDERLVGAFGWSNVGRSFDAVKLTYLAGRLHLDAFAATTRESDSAEQDATFSGLYAVLDETPVGSLEGYALFKNDDRQDFAGELNAAEPGTLSVRTYGFRLTGPSPRAPLSYGIEMAAQNGDYGGDDIEAWAAHIEAVYRPPALPGLGLRAEYNFASGDDDPADGIRGTFDNLFPTNHSKYGYIDFIGWRNTKNVRLGASFTTAAGHVVTLDYHRFWIATSSDDVYRASGAVLLAVPPGISEDEVGSEIDLTWRFSPVEGLGLLAGYSHFFAGALFDAALPGADIEDADFVYLQTTVRF